MQGKPLGYPYTLEDTLTKLGTDSSKALSVFIVGSRLWGTGMTAFAFLTYAVHKESDWDLVVVLTQLPTPSEKNFLSVHKGNLDGLLILKQEFLDRITK